MDIKYSHFAIEFLTLCLLKIFVYIKALWIKLEIILIILNAAFNFTRSIFLFIFNLSFCFKYSSTPGISLTGTEFNLWLGFFSVGETPYTSTSWVVCRPLIKVSTNIWVIVSNFTGHAFKPFPTKVAIIKMCFSAFQARGEF